MGNGLSSFSSFKMSQPSQAAVVLNFLGWRKFFAPNIQLLGVIFFGIFLICLKVQGSEKNEFAFDI